MARERQRASQEEIRAKARAKTREEPLEMSESLRFPPVLTDTYIQKSEGREEKVKET